MDLGANLAGKLQIGIQRFLVLAVDVRLLHVGHQKLSMEPLGVAAACFDRGFGVAARADTYQDSLLSAPPRPHTVSIHVTLKLPSNYLRGNAQIQSAQL